VGVRTFPPTGYRMLDARIAFFYGEVAVSPAEAMRLSGIGSQCVTATVDANKDYFDGAKTYKVTLPKDIPAANFWSLTLYDNQTRSQLDTPQRLPRAGSRSYPSPAAEPNADGSTTVYFAPAQPHGVARQLDPDHPRRRLVRDTAPLPSTRAALRQDLATQRDRAGAVR